MQQCVNVIFSFGKHAPRKLKILWRDYGLGGSFYFTNIILFIDLKVSKLTLQNI